VQKFIFIISTVILLSLRSLKVNSVSAVYKVHEFIRKDREITRVAESQGKYRFKRQSILILSLVSLVLGSSLGHNDIGYFHTYVLGCSDREYIKSYMFGICDFLTVGLRKMRQYCRFHWTSKG